MYHGNRESHRQFADSLYGGTEQALRAAIDWRAWRLVKADDVEHKLIGYYAYADRRRYFSISKHGGWGGAKAAEAWLRERELSASAS